MMRIVRRIGIATVLLCVAGAHAASAKVATCEEIAAAQGRGLSVDAIRQELNTTAARVENCSRLAQRNADHAARESEARARRSARMAARSAADPR